MAASATSPRCKSAEFKKSPRPTASCAATSIRAAPGRNWNDATSLVIQGKAGMQIMGDWAKGEFIAAGQTAGKEYGCTVLSTGQRRLCDGRRRVRIPEDRRIPATDQGADDAGQACMLEPETQIAFTQKKGSIPVRLDVDVSSLDVCAQKAVKLIADKNAAGAGQGAAVAARASRSPRS